MNRKNPIFGFGNDLVIVNAKFVGGGNGADLTVPSEAATTRKITNAAYSGARTGEGTYDCVLHADAGAPEVLAVIPVCSGAGHRAEVTTAYVASTRTIAVTTRDSSGTADDLPTTDTLNLVILARDSMA